MKVHFGHLLCLLPMLLVHGCGEEPETSAMDDAAEVVTLSVSRTIGVEMGDSTNSFGAMTDVCRTVDGDILVLDQTICGVKVFGSNGEYICQIGRSGSGPGEISMPLYVTGLNDGRILVNDVMSNAYVAYDSAFDYIENISLWDNGPPIQACPAADSGFAGILVEFDMEREQPMITRTLGVFTHSKEPDISFLEDEVLFDFTDFTGVLRSMIYSFNITADPRGRFFYSPVSSETYEVFGFDSDGSRLFHITREIPPVEKTRQEIEDEILYIETWAERIGMQGVVIEWNPDPYRDFVKAIGVDGMERLWVARGTELEPVFDVYDMSGAHLFSARLPIESSSWKFHIDRFGILGWEEDPPEGYQKLYVIDFPAV